MYELTNIQRKYFGLSLVDDNWSKQQLNDSITIYFDENKIVKILKYDSGYWEYDTDISTKARHILLPKTARGKEQQLTIPRILKIKGSGIQFSGSFVGGGIHVYDNRRNIFFIKSFEEEKINSYQDIDKWITNYIENLSPDYFNWLATEFSQKRKKTKVREGDIVAFKVAQDLYGFARVLIDVFAEMKSGYLLRPELYFFHPRSLIVATYAYYSNTIQIDIDKLLTKKTLPTVCIFDLDVYRGEMPIVGHRILSELDKVISLPQEKETLITIPYSKMDIDKFIALSQP